MRESQEGNVLRKYRALTWIGAAICFVLIPLLLLNALIDNMLRLRSEKEKQQVFAEMDTRLDFISQNVDIAFYLHKLMQKHVDLADRHTQPLKSLGNSIAALKSRYPGLFKFIVWDARGKTVAALTDEKSYRYIVSKLYGFFGEIAEHCRSEYPGFPELLPVVEKHINMFRAYLGRFLVSSHLRYPFQKGNYGRFILADAPARFPLIWFDSRAGFTIFCSANPLEKHRHVGVKSAIAQLSDSKDKINTAFIDLRQVKAMQPNSDFDHLLQLELGKFENASLPHRELKDHLLAFKLLDPYLRGYCSISKSELKHGYPDRIKTRFFAWLASALAIIFFVVYCYCLRLKRLTFSIQTRIALLFIYANGLPLLVLGTIGHEYLQQLEGSLLHKVHRNHERILEEVDAGYKRFHNVLEENTRNALASYSAEVVERVPVADDLSFFKSLVEKLNAEEAYVYGIGGDVLIGFRRTRKVQSQSILKIFTAYTLRYMNRGTAIEADTGVQLSSPSYLELSRESLSHEGLGVFRTVLHFFDRIEKFSFGTEQRMCFFRLFGNSDKRSFHSLLMLSWLHTQVQETYANHQARELSSGGDSKVQLVSLSQHSGNIIGSFTIAESSLRPILHKGFNLQSARENAVYHAGQRYLVTALAGRQLDNLSLAMIVPADEIELALKKAQTQLLWLGLLSLFIVSGVVFALSRQFIKPVRQLAESVQQIGKRNFTFRSNITSVDEFGDLGKVFNSTMAGMHELEIGKIVQETLLPPAHYRSGRVEIYARSVTMTKLGGDYFDYCQPAPGITGVFMGDVAGHGIPAALIMAMAKSVVMIDSESQADPSCLLSSLHDVLYKLKSDKFKRMMTCQYMILDDETGVCSFANAGHCYPIIVSDTGSSSEFAEIVGLPVGISRRARYKNHELVIKPGDTLILYSDGMLEARNSLGIDYGPERLLELARKAWHSDVEQYYANLYHENLAWSEKIEDDITIVLVRYCLERAV